MKVFISWSGPLSKQIAEILKPWIKCMLQITEPFLSTEDIDKGTIWFSEITDQLADTAIGIICLTRENLAAPWILFEAGSLAKGLSKNRVCTFLINLSPADMKPPLSQFNATCPTQEDMLKLIASINATLGDKALPDEILHMTFNQFWDNFKAKFDAALKAYKPAKQAHQRPAEDMLEELLGICRSTQRTLQEKSLRDIPQAFLSGSYGSGKSAFAAKMMERLLKQENQAKATEASEEFANWIKMVEFEKAIKKEDEPPKA